MFLIVKTKEESTNTNNNINLNIQDVINRCNDYKTQINNFNKEKNDLMEQLDQYKD